MHRIRSGIVGLCLAALLAGCGESVDEGSGGFTPTDTKPLDPLADQMKEVMKKKDHLKKQEAPPEKRKAKEAEKKS